MKNLLAGGLALGVVSVSAIGWAGTSSAQLPEPQFVQLEATLSAEIVDPGQNITVSPQACTPDPGVEGQGIVTWALHDAEDSDPFHEAAVPMGDDGSWELTFTTPSQPGEYWLSAICKPAGEEADQAEFDACVPEASDDAAAAAGGEHGSTTVVKEPEFDCVFEHYEAMFIVAGEAPEPGPRPAPTPAAPATPVPGTPHFTG